MGKRPRDEMEIESVEEIQPINANPSKKRKITLLDEPLSNSTLATDTQSSSDLNSNSKSPEDPSTASSELIVVDDDDEDDQDMICEGMSATISYLDIQPIATHEQASVSGQSSLQPQNLLSEIDDHFDNNIVSIPMSPMNEEEEVEDIKLPPPATPISTMKKKKKFVAISPALSHLSEGDDPLPKTTNSRIRKAIKKSNKPKLTQK